MSENTKIEWCDHTFNPWIGCMKIGPGCDNCYAEADFDKRRHVVHWGSGQPRKRTSEANWAKPLTWNRNHNKFFFKQNGRRQRVFCASLADVFDNEVDPQWRRDLFDLIELTPNLDWLLLTKRIGNVVRMLPTHDWAMRPNVWLGATIVNQEEADRDIPKLLATPARVRFLSMEPLLGPVDLSRVDIDGHSEIYPLKGTPGCEDYDGNPIPDMPALDWIIVGGESGSNARPMHSDWVRNLRDQCQSAGVPFLFKQWGEWAPGDACDASTGDAMYALLDAGRYCVVGQAGDTHPRDAAQVSQPSVSVYRAGKKAAGRMLDGRTWNEFPGARP